MRRCKEYDEFCRLYRVTKSTDDASATITPADADILTACSGTWRKDAFNDRHAVEKQL
jgi:hypothetical protein